MKPEASFKCTVGSVLVVLIASLLFGIIIGSTGPSIDTMKNEVINFEGHTMRLPETSEFVVFTASQASWFSALVAIGALVGALIGGPMVNAFGHKVAIAVTCPIYVTSFVIQAQFSNVWLLFLSRWLTGISVGINSFTVPTYISEISPNHLRGLLGACNQLSITLGILLVYLLGANLTVDGGFVLSSEDPSHALGLAPPESFCNWRLLALINTIPTCVLLILITLIPESPHWYARKGRIEEALVAHRRLRGGFEIQDETNELVYLEATHTSKGSTLSPTSIRPIFICIALVFFQQFSGINAIMFFCTTILRNAKIEAADTISITIMAEQVVFTALACYLMDKVGRRILLISSAAVMMFATALFGLYFFLQALGASNITPLVFVSVYTYMAAFSLGVGPIPWLLMGEVIPSNLRASGSSIVTAHNWLFAFAVTVGLDSYTNMVGFHGVMWTFAICCLALTIFATFLVPETRNKSFEEIAAFFGHQYTQLPKDVEKADEEALGKSGDTGVETNAEVVVGILEIDAEPQLVVEQSRANEPALDDVGDTHEEYSGVSKCKVLVEQKESSIAEPYGGDLKETEKNEVLVIHERPLEDECPTPNQANSQTSPEVTDLAKLAMHMEKLIEKVHDINKLMENNAQHEAEVNTNPTQKVETNVQAQSAQTRVVYQQAPLRIEQPPKILHQGIPQNHIPSMYHSVSVPQYMNNVFSQGVVPVSPYVQPFNGQLAYI